MEHGASGDQVSQILVDWKEDILLLRSKYYNSIGVINGWNIDKPPACYICGSVCIPAAVDTGDGFGLFWDCPDNDCPCYKIDCYEQYEIPWPFYDNLSATWDDLREIGFKVLY